MLYSFSRSDLEYLGTINPLKDIIQEAHDHDTFVVVDGAQSVPHEKLNLKELIVIFSVSRAIKSSARWVSEYCTEKPLFLKRCLLTKEVET